MTAPSTFSKNNLVYYDEEECLGFDVFTAELELIVGSSRGERKPDGIQLLELLQKLQSSIDRTDRTVLRASQKRAEGALVEVLTKGACAQVRQLITACLYKLYTSADLLPMYSRISWLQSYMQDKEKDRNMSDAARTGLLELLAHLSLHLGRHLASYAPESMAIAVKTAAKSAHPVPVRVAALRLAAAAVEGLSSADRNAAAVQLEAWRAFDKHSRDKSSDEVRAAAVGVLAALARGGGGAQLWSNGGYGFEEAVKACCLALEDPARSVREASATALGDLAASAHGDAVKASLEAEKRPAKKAAAEKLVAGAFKTCLVAPFVDAAAHGKRDVCTALALGWVSYAALMQSSGRMDVEGLVDLAVLAVGMLESSHRAVCELWDKGGQLPGEGELGSCLAGGELPLPQACVIYVLRVAVVAALPEAGQRKLLDKLVALAANSIAPPVLVATLEGMGALLEVLGEVPEDSARALESTIDSHLTSSATAVRHQAAAAFAALALASPAAAARLLGECIERLETCAQQLAMLAARYGKAGVAAVVSGAASGAAPGASGTPRGAPDSQCKHCIDALHGNALGVASLLVAAAKLPLGVPTRLPSSAYWIAKRLIGQPHSQPAWAKAAEREAGYIVLGAFCAAAHPGAVAERQEEVLELLGLALGTNARDALGSEKGASKPGSEGELAVALWWRSAALQALSAYVLGVLCKGLADDLPGQVRDIASMLAPVLDVVSNQPALQEPSKGPRTGPGAVVAAAAAMLQLRLLEVFFFLPGAPLFAACHGPLIKMCARQLQGLNGSHILPEAAASVCSTSLKHMLSGQEAMLGPWLPGRDLLEDELRTFTGDRGGPQQHPWEAGLAFTAGALGSGSSQLLSGSSGPEITATANGNSAADANGAGGIAGAESEQQHQHEAVRLTRRFMPYPQPYALAPALLEVQLWLLGKMLAVVSPANQLHVLEVMLSAVSTKTYPALKKDKEQQRQRTANCIAVAITALAGLAPLAKRGRSSSEGIDKIAEKVLQLASALIEDNVGDTVLLRVGSEMISAACCIGSDALAIKQARAMCDQLKALVAEGQAGATPPEFRAVLSLALGSIHRAKGGITLQALVPSTVECLTAVASRPINNVHLWALHALWLVANAAGPSYHGHVKQTLQLSQELLVSSFGDNPLLKPATGRLANALVAVLGPEFKLGSSAYQKCKSLVTDLSTLDAGHDVYRGVEATWAELEQVLFAQQLILFAPRAVPAAKHIPLLQATLASKRPALRRAAAATLRHLAERDADAVLKERIEPALLSALDSETDGQIAEQLRATLQVLLLAGAPSDSAYWLAVLSDVALAAPAPAARRNDAGPVSTAPDADLGDDEQLARAPTPPPRPSPSPRPSTPHGNTASTPGGNSSSRPSATTTPRLRTRLFAAELLLALFAAVGNDPRHRIPPQQPQGNDDEVTPAAASNGHLAGATWTAGDAAASQQGDGSYLVDQLEALVDLGFKLATGGTEALKPAGARLMARVVTYFATVQDPVAPECKILDQYQAQFVSALRAALAPGAPPALSIAGGALATSFLESGLADGDAAVMLRLMGLLCAPLSRWRQLSYTAYAESVGVRVKVALLQAHAQCATIGLRSTAAAAGGLGSGLGRTASGRGSLGLARSGSGRGSGFGAPGSAVCEGVVAKAQAPYKELLLLLWGVLLQDQAVLRTQHPAVVAQYRSVLWGDSSPDIIAAVQPCLASAWPVVLEAAASCMPPPADIATARDAADSQSARMISEWEAFEATLAGASSGDGSAGLDAKVYTKQLKARSWLLYSNLLDFSMMAVSDEAQGITSPSQLAGAVRLGAALRALQQLLKGAALEAGLVQPGVLVELLQLLQASCEEVLCPRAWASLESAAPDAATQQAALAGTLSSVADLLKETASSMPEQQLLLPAANVAADGVAAAANGDADILENQNVSEALVEALLCTSSAALPYRVQDEPSSGNSSIPVQRYIPVGPPSTSAASSSMDPVLVSVLVAAQKLLRRLPVTSDGLGATVAPLLQMGLRLLLTAPPGVQHTAAQRFLEGALASTLDRALSSSSSSSSNGSSNGSASGSAGVVCTVAGAVQGVAVALADAVAAACKQFGSSSSSSRSADGVAAPCLPPLLACLLSAMASLNDATAIGKLSSSNSADAKAAVAHCCTVLLSGLDASKHDGKSPPSALPTLEALRPLLQEATAESPPGRKSALALHLLAALGPAIAASVHTSVARAAAAGQALSGADLPLAAESLKVLVLAVTAAAPRGEAAQAAVMRVLVPLLVEVAAPPNGSPAAPMLRDMAVKLVTAMPASASGAAFRTVVAALPAESKQRLQVALKDAAAAAAAAAVAQPGAVSGIAGVASASGSGVAAVQVQKKPAIALKMNFAVPGPAKS